jgi:hypothetical protein
MSHKRLSLRDRFRVSELLPPMFTRCYTSLELVLCQLVST